MSGTTNNSSAKLDRSGVNRIITVLVTNPSLRHHPVRRRRPPRLAGGVDLPGHLPGRNPGLRVMGTPHNPNVINERGRIGKNTKSWDKLIGLFSTLFLAGTLVTAGLDARHAWSAVPLWAKLLGGAAFIISLLLAFSAMMANTFLSTFVRIQDERGHTTVSSGPYRFIRHPMYAGMLFHVLGYASVARFLVGHGPGRAEYCSLHHPYSAGRSNPAS